MELRLLGCLVQIYVQESQCVGVAVYGGCSAWGLQCLGVVLCVASSVWGLGLRCVGVAVCTGLMFIKFVNF